MTAYAGGASLWAHDAAPVYRPLAEHLLAVRPEAGAPIELSGRMVLDAGSGSGVVGDLLRGRRAQVISVDIEPDMVAYLASKGTAVLADIRSLPLADDSVAITVAAFVLNHLPDPATGLTELSRVTRPSGWLLASVFGNDRAPAKTAVDEVAARFGFEPPGWYVDLQRAAATVGTVDRMADTARRAGLRSVQVDEQSVSLGSLSAADVVAYRCALPHLRPFVAGLGAAERARFRSAATAAVMATGMPFEPVLIRLLARPTGRSSDHSSRLATASRSRTAWSPEAAIRRVASSVAVWRAAGIPVAA